MELPLEPALLLDRYAQHDPRRYCRGCTVCKEAKFGSTTKCGLLPPKNPETIPWHALMYQPDRSLQQLVLEENTRLVSIV